MKAQVVDPGWTIVNWVVFVGVVIVLFLFTMAMSLFGKGSVSYSIAFVDSTNEPYLVAEALANMKIEETNFLEQSIATIAVDKLDNKITGSLEEFLDNYKIKYRVILKNSKTFLDIGKEKGFRATLPIFYKDKIGYLVIS